MDKGPAGADRESIARLKPQAGFEQLTKRTIYAKEIY